MTALCPKCGSRSQIFDSRIRAGITHRRRKCESCDFRWGTVEIEIDLYKTRRELTEVDHKRLRYAKRILEDLIK